MTSKPYARRNRSGRIAACAVCILILAAVSFGTLMASGENGLLEITFIDVGQGDSTLIKSPDGKYMLIDAGEYRNVSAVIEAIDASGLLRLDCVIATHPHSDHVGGLSEVYRRYDVGTAYDIGRVHPTSSYEYYLDAVKASKAKFMLIREGSSFKLGANVSIIFIWPGKDIPQDLNNASAAFYLKYGDFDALFMADCGVDTESALLRSGKITPVELLKVGHHGSRHSSSSDFLRAASAELGVIFAGKGNDYGYPQQDTLKRLSDAGVQVMRTDLNGSITVSSDGRSWWASAENGQKAGRQAASLPVSIAKPAAAKPTYVGSLSSSVFHISDCEAVASIAKANLVTYASREDAVSKGKRPCKICNP